MGGRAAAGGGVSSVRAVCEHVFVLSTNQKGALAEAEIVAAAVRAGVSVLRPAREHGRYDLAFDIGDRVWRVQCKWGALDPEGAIIRVYLQTSRRTPTGYLRAPYTQAHIDLVAVYCQGLDQCYLLPGAVAWGRTAIVLRQRPPRNGQRACINLASNFEFAGAVAQLEERRHGMAEVRGSSPLSSTSPPAGRRTGCHEFRSHFGYYLDQAASGHVIEITRHGRPYARLVPSQPQLAAA